MHALIAIRRHVLSFGSFIVLMLAGSSISMANTVNSVWMYGFENGFDNATEVGYLSSMGINQVYLSIGSVAVHRMIDDSSGSYDASYTNNLADFISRSNNAGISVHAMTLEDPFFTDTNNHSFGSGLIDNILSYNSRNANAAFDGIHINVEAHNPLVWQSGTLNELNVLLAGYNILTSSIYDQINTFEAAVGQNIIFSGSVAWWYNENAYSGVLPNGYATLLSQNLDVLIPLVFDGVGGSLIDIVNKSGDEISAAPTIIGIGTHEFATYGDVMGVRTGLDATFSGYPNYLGTAIFDYNSLKTQYLASTVVPEPISSMLFLIGGATLVVIRYVKRKKKA